MGRSRHAPWSALPRPGAWPEPPCPAGAGPAPDASPAPGADATARTKLLVPACPRLDWKEVAAGSIPASLHVALQGAGEPGHPRSKQQEGGQAGGSQGGKHSLMDQGHRAVTSECWAAQQGRSVGEKPARAGEETQLPLAAASCRTCPAPTASHQLWPLVMGCAPVGATCP